MTTSQIAQRLHNFTSRRLSARSIIAHNHLFLFLSSPFISNFLFANEFRITFTLFHDVVRNFPIGEQWDSCNSLARAKSENRVSPEFPDSLRLIVTDCHRSYRRVEWVSPPFPSFVLLSSLYTYKHRWQTAFTTIVSFHVNDIVLQESERSVEKYHWMKILFWNTSF